MAQKAQDLGLEPWPWLRPELWLRPQPQPQGARQGSCRALTGLRGFERREIRKTRKEGKRKEKEIKTNREYGEKPVAQRHQMVSNSLALLLFNGLDFHFGSRPAALIGDKVPRFIRPSDCLPG